MYAQETITPYGDTADKAVQVEQMFDRIAPTYDRLNHRLSWNIDRGWRRRAVVALAPYSPQRVLDVATGTGDFALLAARQLRPQRVVGVDLSEAMMDIARQKADAEGLAHVVHFQREDALALSFADETFDAVTAAFGIRNFAHLEQGLREMWRVTRKGGHLSIVELTRPTGFPMRQLFHAYAHTVLPLYGHIVARDREAYTYLTKTIEAFPQGEHMQQLLKRVGFSEATFQRLTFGICTLYVAVK